MTYFLYQEVGTYNNIWPFIEERTIEGRRGCQDDHNSVKKFNRWFINKNASLDVPLLIKISRNCASMHQTFLLNEFDISSAFIEVELHLNN